MLGACGLVLREIAATFTPRARHRAAWTITLVVLGLVGAELVLQVRMHLLTGRSVFNALRGQSTTIIHPVAGVKVFRPHATIHGDNQVMVINGLGLRSPEVTPVRADNEIRIAVLGASSVAGAYAATNEDTFPQLMGEMLRRRHPGLSFSVINAGIEGHVLDDTRRLYQAVVAPLKPDLVILYPGFNDMARLCRRGTDVEASRPALPFPSLPRWLLTSDMVLKNTVFLREAPAASKRYRDPATIDGSDFRADLETLVSTVRGQGTPMILSTMARSFRRDMPREQQLRLSETARLYNGCLDMEGLVAAGETYNRRIVEVAQAQGLEWLRMDEVVPGGSRYFVDANHFTAAGEQLVAAAFAAAVERVLLPPKRLTARE